GCLKAAGIFREGDVVTLQNMIENVLPGKNKYQVDSGKSLFDWIYVANAASAHILASEALLTAISCETDQPPISGEAFFITNGDPMPLWGFVGAIGEAAGPCEEGRCLGHSKKPWTCYGFDCRMDRLAAIVLQADIDYEPDRDQIQLSEQNLLH
ncbi:MAG: hypothetical protein Q9224_007047, partial [Gallowayella concinna]